MLGSSNSIVEHLNPVERRLALMAGDPLNRTKFTVNGFLNEEVEDQNLHLDTVRVAWRYLYSQTNDLFLSPKRMRWRCAR